MRGDPQWTIIQVRVAIDGVYLAESGVSILQMSSVDEVLGRLLNEGCELIGQSQSSNDAKEIYTLKRDANRVR